MVWTFVGLWAIRKLGAGQATVGLAYLGRALIGVRGEGAADEGLVPRDRARSAVLGLPALGGARVARLRRLRGRAADLARPVARPLACDLGFPPRGQPGARDALPAAADAVAPAGF